MSGPPGAAGGTPRPIGARRISPAMLEERHRADAFTGLPRGTARPLRFLAAFQEALPCLGLPVHAFTLVAWLVKLTQAQDWEDGSRPIAWPSAQRQAEYLGLGPAQVKALNRALYEAGVFVLRDSAQGRRYGRRGPDGRIIEAYGFDLSPLALRYDEFVRIAAAAKVERGRVKALRARVTQARRAVRQAGETLAGLGGLPDGWAPLQVAVAGLVAAARRAERSEELTALAKALERRQAEAEAWLRAAARSVEPVETNPQGPENQPLTTSTNSPENPSDTVVAQEESSRAERSGETGRVPFSPPAGTEAAAQAVPERVFRLTPAQVLDLVPRLAHCVLTNTPTWRDLTDAAGGSLRHVLGVSPWLWGEACRVMGREGATLALALVSTRAPGHFRTTPGGYFAGMVKKAERGELHLERTLWALREAKWGKPNRRRVN